MGLEKKHDKINIVGDILDPTQYAFDQRKKQNTERKTHCAMSLVFL